MTKRILLVLIIVSASNAFAYQPQAAKKHKGKQQAGTPSWVDKTSGCNVPR